MWKLTGKLPKVAMPEEAASALGFDNGAYVELGFQVAGFGLQVCWPSCIDGWVTRAAAGDE